MVERVYGKRKKFANSGHNLLPTAAYELIMINIYFLNVHIKCKNMMKKSVFVLFQLYESKHLPSPLCERFEDPIFTQPSVSPACKSTWELDFTTDSVKNYQMVVLVWP